jgi:hypothetical protein
MFIMGGWEGLVWEVTSAPFCCEPKTALKNKICFKNLRKKMLNKANENKI